MTDTTSITQSTPAAEPLLMALELGKRQWLVGFSTRTRGVVRRRTVRAVAIELAWYWLQYQPTSALSQWYRQRWSSGGRRLTSAELSRSRAG